MNKLAHCSFCLLLLFSGISMPALAAAQTKSSQAESFYIVSSVDAPKSQILLKRPTEVTELLKVTSPTKYFDEKGKPIAITDLRAGDTVWVKSKSDGPGEATAISIRKGPMTVVELHRLYLDYPEVQ